jgi:hypothetical protein
MGVGVRCAGVTVSAIAVLALASCGSSDNVSQDELRQARHEAAQQARQSERIRQLQQDLRELQRPGGAGGKDETSSGSTTGPSGGSVTPGNATGVASCGGDVSVGPNTSCPFALNVVAEYQRTGQGVIDVYSPVTGETYTMVCTGGAPHICTGGNNATVYFP